ncbi:MAG: ATP-binding protein [Lachnospiraceae bacterium]|nr:ATP-binding protein [Lachnospiraceae bacterium]
MWQLMDLMECGVRACLFLYLCGDAICFKNKYAKQGKYLFFLLFVLSGFWISNSGWLKVLLYGESAVMQKSSASIVKVFLMMLLCFILLSLLCEGRRIVKVYMSLLYETIIEMAKFGVHGVWSFCMNAYSNWQLDKALGDDAAMDAFIFRLTVLGYIWNLLLMLLYFTVAYLTIRAVLKYRQGLEDVDRQGILFLMLSPAVGMAFDVILRCLFFTKEGNGYDFIYDKHSGMYAIIPIMAFLCLLSVIYSAKIYKELMLAEEEKNNMFFYKQQLADMTGHVQDMERLYDGIRAMRHDMNNCIADLEQLFAASKKKGLEMDRQVEAEPGRIESEARRYLYRMRNAMDTLSPQYHTGNPVTDVILSRKFQVCVKEGITLESDFLYPANLGIEAFDLGILLNNALDNAIEACQKCTHQKPLSIRVHSYQKKPMFFLHIENDCDSALLQKTPDLRFLTTKDDKWMHGIGLKNMRSVVERYWGTMSVENRGNVFVLTIMLQAPKG